MGIFEGWVVVHINRANQRVLRSDIPRGDIKSIEVGWIFRIRGECVDPKQCLVPFILVRVCLRIGRARALGRFPRLLSIARGRRFLTVGRLSTNLAQSCTLPISAIILKITHTSTNTSTYAYIIV